MATKQRKAAPRTRTPSRKSTKSKKKKLGSLQRFLISFTSTTAVVFGFASYVLNPQLIDTLRNSPVLSRIGWPNVDYVAPSPAPASASTTPVTYEAQQNTVTRFTRCPQFFPGGQAPQLPAGNHLRELCFNAFAVLYNSRTKTPLVVVERLNRATLLRAHRQHRTDKFYPEARLPRTERAELEDYKGSGYSRGHMAPAADMGTPEAMAQSFSLANMVPQNQTHNAGAWSEIEQDTRKYVMRARGDVYVFTGPLFSASPSTVGRGHVAVPSHLFKLVYDPATGKSWAYLQANRADTRTEPPIRYADFAQRTGLQLLGQDGTVK